MMQAVTRSNNRAEHWDGFLLQHPLGHFQQSGRWGSVKELDGWTIHRQVKVTRENIEAGFQLLWKRTRFGRIGYVSKGPVVAHESPHAIESSLREVRQAAAQIGLRALILQPPDASIISPGDLQRHGFSSVPLPSVTNATVLVDLQGGAAAVEKNLGRTMRREVRDAVKAGVIISSGGRQDLRKFFELMQATCLRQNTRPNPGRPEILEAIWDEFFPAIRLSFARIGDQLLAGLLLIPFGGRVTFWKKGWVSVRSTAPANALLNTSELIWAAGQGHRQADFLALDRDLAERILSGRELSDDQRRSRHIFNLKLGGRPQLLPHGMILILNPAFRRCFDSLARFSFSQRLMSRLISAG